MENSRPGQEKLAAALSAFLFFIPLLMEVRTPFVVKYMKQGFIINVVQLSLSIVSSFLLWGFMGIVGLLYSVCFLTSIWLAFQALNGKEFTIQVLLEQSDKLIQALGIGKWFISK